MVGPTMAPVQMKLASNGIILYRSFDGQRPCCGAVSRWDGVQWA